MTASQGVKIATALRIDPAAISWLLGWPDAARRAPLLHAGSAMRPAPRRPIWRTSAITDTTDGSQSGRESYRGGRGRAPTGKATIEGAPEADFPVACPKARAPRQPRSA